MKRKKIFLLCSALVMLCGIVLIAGLNESGLICKKELNNGRYYRAVLCYDIIYDIKTKENLQQLFLNEIWYIKEEYANKDATYDETLSKLKSLGYNSDVKDMVKKAERYVEELRISDESYKAGIASMENNEYEKAVNEFKCVIKEDVNNYEKAEMLINKCRNTIKKENKFIINSCYISYSQSDISNIYKDQIQIKLTNNFDKTIKSFTVCFAAFDRTNHPVIIDSDFNYNNSYFILCYGQNVDIKPYSIWGDGTMGWNINNTDNIYKVEANIKDIEFEDGTIWRNQLYNTWLENEMLNYW